MTEKYFIDFLKKLKPSDWSLKVNNNWNIKDVVAHLLGWAEIDMMSFKKIDDVEIPPWRLSSFDVDSYNSQIVKKYSKIEPSLLIGFWENLCNRRDEYLEEIDIEKIRAKKDFARYVLDGGNARHNLHHYQQIKKALEE